MADLSTAGAAVGAASLASSLILVTPQDVGISTQTPVTALGVVKSALRGSPSFYFHYNGEKTVTLESDITDHYVEDNTALQDQIALKPELLGMAGFIAELSDFLQPGSAGAILKQTVDKLVLLAPLMPQVSLTALIAYNLAAQGYSALGNIASAAQSTASAFGVGGPVQNKQQIAYSFFRKAWKARMLFTVQTPWEVYKDVALKMVKATEEEGTTDWTGFTIQFKKMTFTSSAFGALGSLDVQGRLAAAASPEVNLGSTTGIPGPALGDSMASARMVK